LSFRADDAFRVGWVLAVPRRWALASGVSLRWARAGCPPARPWPRGESFVTFDFDIAAGAGFFAMSVPPSL